MNLTAIRVLIRKELKESFNSPMPYIFLTVFFLVAGWFYVSSLFLMGQATLEDFFSPMPLLLVFFMPAFTMRLFSEEYKSGTVELLSTLPLRDTEIVLGKYLAALAVWALMLGMSLFYQGLLVAVGRPDIGQSLTGYFGAFLLGAFYLAAGLFASSLTRSQVVAFLLGFFFAIFFFLCGKAAHMVPGIWGTGLTFLGVDAHYESFLRGVIDTRDVVYYLSGLVLFLGATLAGFNSRRWR
ncbi:MAG TPA: ABC transporter permease subunit [Elusimicrobiota bacterium]|nr:ABC transporter permease subunit [Elusimicrobiota bacterium]